jgi:hypothetical protein
LDIQKFKRTLSRGGEDRGNNFVEIFLFLLSIDVCFGGIRGWGLDGTPLPFPLRERKQSVFLVAVWMAQNSVHIERAMSEFACMRQCDMEVKSPKCLTSISN